MRYGATATSVKAGWKVLLRHLKKQDTYFDNAWHLRETSRRFPCVMLEAVNVWRSSWWPWHAYSQHLHAAYQQLQWASCHSVAERQPSCVSFESYKFCVVRMLVSLETIVSVLIGLARTAVLILYWYSMSTLHCWKKIGVKLLKPLPLFGNNKNFALNKRSPAEIFRDLYLLKLNRFVSASEYGPVPDSCEWGNELTVSTKYGEFVD